MLSCTALGSKALTLTPSHTSAPSLESSRLFEEIWAVEQGHQRRLRVFITVLLVLMPLNVVAVSPGIMRGLSDQYCCSAENPISHDIAIQDYYHATGV